MILCPLWSIAVVNNHIYVGIIEIFNRYTNIITVITLIINFCINHQSMLIF